MLLSTLFLKYALSAAKESPKYSSSSQQRDLEDEVRQIQGGRQ